MMPSDLPPSTDVSQNDDAISQENSATVPSELVASPHVSVSTHNNVMVSSMPTAVFPLLWNFILDVDSNQASFIDFKGVATLLLVSKSLKESFHACQGWLHCAHALRREATIAIESVKAYQQQSIVLLNTPAMNMSSTDTANLRLHLEKADMMRQEEARILLLLQTLLPAACHLASTYTAVSYIGQQDIHYVPILHICIQTMEAILDVYSRME